MQNQALEADRDKAVRQGKHVIDGLIKENQDIRTQLAETTEKLGKKTDFCNHLRQKHHLKVQAELSLLEDLRKEKKRAEVESELAQADRALAKTELRQQIETLTADRQQLQAELAELQQRLDAAEQNSPPAIDLSGKAGELVNFFRTLLPKDAKLPKNTMSKLREILETIED